MSIETMTKISTYTVTNSGGDATVTFSNIPQHFTDIVLKCSIRSTAGSNLSNPVITVNSDTTGTYFRKEMYAEGTSTTGGEYVQDRLVGSCPGGNASASVFGNLEVYFSNYRSNSYKNYNFDANSPSTSTSAYSIWSGSTLYYSAAPITSITTQISGSANYAQHSTFTLYGIKNAAQTVGNSIKAIGGNISFDGTYVYHSFNTSGTFTPTTNLTADYILVAGGGAGGGGNGGGGGAGGLIYRTNQSFSPSSYGITIGAGGSGGLTNDRGPSGSNSSFAGLTAIGGGGGGGFNTNAIGGSGGSGGGGSSYDGTGNTTIAGGTATSGQGNNGGTGTNGSGYPYHGGGGGGAGAVGSNATLLVSGNGGSGSLYFGQYYAGGGGGGGDKGSGTTTAGTGGLGGGGLGGTPATTAVAGLTNTGGGGGGEGGGGGGANGGSGVVIIRYKG
jgi:hypothetical protein